MSKRFSLWLGGALLSSLLALVFLAGFGTEAALAATEYKPGFIGFITHYMAPIMFASLVALLLMGYPVAFALAACGLLFAVIGRLDWFLLLAVIGSALFGLVLTWLAFSTRSARAS